MLPWRCCIEPRIAENVREVVLMGGAANVPGNVSPVAEANIHNDPEAAYIVFHAGWPITMVGLDVTHKTVMTPEYLDELRSVNNPWTDFIYKITPFYLAFSQRFGSIGFPVHDSSALAYVIDPTLFDTKKPMSTSTTTAPMPATPCLTGAGSAGGSRMSTVCVDVDSARFLDLYRSV